MEQASHREVLDLLRQSVDKGVDEKNLPDNPLLKNVICRLVEEQAAYLGVMDEGDSIKLLHAAQQKISQALQKVGDSGDLEIILRAEELLLDNERIYTDTSLMEASLDNALGDIEAALNLVYTVQDPEAYKAIADGYTRPRNRIGNLPKDEARQFFKSHRARLENLEKARLMGLEKVLIAVRKNNLEVARAGYIELQEIALAGQEPEPEVNKTTKVADKKS